MSALYILTSRTIVAMVRHAAPLQHVRLSAVPEGRGLPQRLIGRIQCGASGLFFTQFHMQYLRSAEEDRLAGGHI